MSLEDIDQAKIKQCLCGATPVLFWSKKRGGYSWGVFCRKCFIESEEDYEKHIAIEIWNCKVAGKEFEREIKEKGRKRKAKIVVEEKKPVKKKYDLMKGFYL